MNSSKIRKSVIFFSFLLLLSPAWSRAQSDSEVSDPIEPVNRGVFWVNNKLDENILEPVAHGYADHVPSPIKKGIGNFFLNLRYPVYLVSDLVQFKFTQAAEHTGRFLLNTTAGLVGFIDVAKDCGLPDHEEDFGIALAYYGVPAGPYLMLPFIGPSNLRDTTGLIIDSFLNPIYWVGRSNLSSDAKFAIAAGATAIKYVDIRAGLIDAIDTAKQSSVDYYLFVQGAYYQHRRGVLYDGNPPDEDDNIDYDASYKKKE